VATMESMLKANDPGEVWFALLGRRDMPADGVADYCARLRDALAKKGIELRLARVDWVGHSWLYALRILWREKHNWYGKWVILQYTAMGWSRRGFSAGALLALAVLRIGGARCAVMCHEPSGTEGPRLIDRIRCVFQNWIVRTLHRFSEKSIFTVPLNTVPWLSGMAKDSAFIPLGTNIPENLALRSATSDQNGTVKSVVVFCVSDPPYRQQELNDISGALCIAADSGIKLRITFVGRGTFEAKDEIERAFQGSQIEICNRGLCEADEVARILSESDAMLAVRGRLYLRRASALAGLACGLPIVGYEGASQGTVIEQAGVVLVPFGDREALGTALRSILTDSNLWQQMHEKNVRMQQQYFSWDVIAASYIQFFTERSA
jgi:hypothetical protein